MPLSGLVRVAVSAEVFIQRAQGRARRLYPNSEGFQGSYVKGVRARLAGRDAESCPYRKKGWRAWRRAWMLGWHSVE